MLIQEVFLISRLGPIGHLTDLPVRCGIKNEGEKKMETTLTITVLETSDIHGNIYPLHYAANEHTDVGLGKIASLVKKEREQNKHVLVIDNGDLIQGTPLTYHYAKYQSDQPNPMVKLLNVMQYDAAVFGNHEFNYGQELLNRAISDSHFPWLSANILDEKTNTPFYGQPYLIKELPEGVRIGVLGLTTPYIPNWEKPEHIVGLKFEDAVASAKKWVRFLREQEKADVVIVSYHGGFERDLDTGEPTERLTGENQGYQLCEEVEGIDLLLTGHQHRQIAGKKINGVAVLQPGCNGLALGKATLKLQKENTSWKCVDACSMLLSTETVEADPHILSLTESYERTTQTWLDQPIGKIQGDMTVKDPMEIRMKDNPFIEFINHVQMLAAEVDISATALFDNKSPGFPQNVTMRDVVSNYIYPNTLKVIRITGQDMKDALERSASYFKQYDGNGTIEVHPSFTTPKPQHYNYDMWEGIDYLIHISKPIGERIVKLEYKGKPVAMDQQFDVVMNNYRAGGGGDYFMYQNKPVIKEIPIDVAELIANYFLEKKVVKATENHNWSVIYD